MLAFCTSSPCAAAAEDVTCSSRRLWKRAALYIRQTGRSLQDLDQPNPPRDKPGRKVGDCLERSMFHNSHEAFPLHSLACPLVMYVMQLVIFSYLAYIANPYMTGTVNPLSDLLFCNCNCSETRWPERGREKAVTGVVSLPSCRNKYMS